jgi:hypothetical protein
MLPEPRPRVTLEIFDPLRHAQIFYLGPDAPRLTSKQIDLLHKVWLELIEEVREEELHHRDVVPFALHLLASSRNEPNVER